MIDIKISDIRALLNNYHEDIKKMSSHSSSFRMDTKDFPNIIIALNDFVTDLEALPTYTNLLSLEQAYQLTLILLGRKMPLSINEEAKLSERLVKEFEEKLFNKDEFSELKEHFDSDTLDLDSFTTVCNQHKKQLSFLLPETIEIPLAEKLVLSKTGHYYHNLFSNKNAEHLSSLRQLLSHGALGELEQAEVIWRKYPELLECYGTIYHPNRIYEGDIVVSDIPFHNNPGRYKYDNFTYLQILWVNEEYEEARLIEEIVGPNEMARQFFEVFPNHTIKKDNFDLEYAEGLLRKLFIAISEDTTLTGRNRDQMNDDTRAALYALHDYAKPTSEHKTGLVFDVHFYIAAVELYEKYANSYINHSTKRSFWCSRASEWLAGCLGTGYLRWHTQGYNKKEVHRRGCFMENESPYFAFRRKANSIPGLHWSVGVDGFGRNATTASGLGLGPGPYLHKLAQAKKILADDLCSRATQVLKQTDGPSRGMPK